MFAGTFGPFFPRNLPHMLSEKYFQNPYISGYPAPAVSLLPREIYTLVCLSRSVRMTSKQGSPPLDIPVPSVAQKGTNNTPVHSVTVEQLPEFPFGKQHDPYSRAVDFSQLSRHLHKVEVSRLGDDLAYALGAF